MGGDDLNDDFQYEAISEASEGNVTDNNDEEDITDNSKRKLPVKETRSTAKRQRLSSAKGTVLITSGRGIGRKGLPEQCRFLKTLLKHHLLLSGGSVEEMTEPSEGNFVVSDKTTLLEQIKDSISMKKLKRWKHTHSPCIVVVAVSARRSVQVLKALSGLKTRAAKLFPKNGDEKSQRDLLSQNSFGLAVGTPHRLNLLCDGEGGMNFMHTQLLVIDSQPNHKDFTVATMPDTSGDFATLIRKHAMPLLKRRKDMKIAFF